MVGIRAFRYYKISLYTFFWTLVNRINATFFWDIKLGKRSIFCGKTVFHKAQNSNIYIGDDCMFVSNADTRNLIGINRPCIINTQTENSTITIGDKSGFSGTVISAFVGVNIGRNVKCGANTLITDSDWHPEDPRSGKPSPVNIGDNVWLGVNVVVLKGVTIGENTVIGANSLVNKSIPSGVMAAGNPCKVIKAV